MDRPGVMLAGIADNRGMSEDDSVTLDEYVVLDACDKEAATLQELLSFWMAEFGEADHERAFRRLMSALAWTVHRGFVTIDVSALQSNPAHDVKVRTTVEGSRLL